MTDELAAKVQTQLSTNGAGAAPANGQANGNGAAAANTNGHADEDGGDGDDDDDDEDGDAAGGEGGATGGASKKKKKKNKKSGAAKRRAKANRGPNPVMAQSDPPRVGLTKIYADGIFPIGEIVEYDRSKWDENTKRVTDEERRERERLQQEGDGNNYNIRRRAAEVHRQVRAYARRSIKPGMTMTEIANLIEDTNRALVEGDGLEAGIGFPTGLSLNEVAAHYTPNAGDKRVLQQGDVLKVDIGVHVQGRIVDSAFTLTFEDKWNPLLDAVKAATNAGIAAAGIDARLGEIGAVIQEVMESHEFEADGKLQHVKCVQNLQGHSINPYVIHGGKSVPIVAQPNNNIKMEEGETYAIETFGSTGRGYVVDSGECSHYARRTHPPQTTLRVASARTLLNTINKNFGTIPFCRRYLDRLGEKNYLLGLKHLVQAGIVQDYPPLADEPGSMTAQFEHTIMLRPTCKEIVSRGEDY
ncbi:Methionine aminopeptidase 2 [Tilletia horrida]|uniref:Methionine aminopeptidase 2 n=1 Tax=Tilletia horrida TaxID=155126 RepID=A0AAN6JVC6_9BASI|nr:Methionine aminopeptidase 2 [Tilletia horrida]KAK0568268.1 Methionine aminopeptidase 2 [Tilletia horrida]